jgi:hypothetical protein
MEQYMMSVSPIPNPQDHLNSKITDLSRTLIDSFYIMLLEEFRMYNSNGKNLYCSYMSKGQNYQNELLVIVREPTWWPADFSTVELNNGGVENVFRNKVLHPAWKGVESLVHSRKNINNIMTDPSWCLIKEIVMKLGICKDEANWSSCIALTYLYKIAYSKKCYLREKPGQIQFEHCREILYLELFKLKPKRILFLTGMKFAQDFLYLSDCSGLEDCVCPLGDFDYEYDKVKTVVSVHPRKYHRKELVDLILAGFRG